MTRADLASALKRYVPHSEEKYFIPRCEELLNHARCFHRDHLPGHFTGSAWITNREHTHTLLVHHAKLNRWLQPGGHADGDENLLAVALREAHEETGVVQFEVVTPAFFDIDIHPIPTRPDFPAHDHYDFRFWLIADPAEKIQVSEESHDVRWVSFDELHLFTKEESVLRLREKSSGRWGCASD
jgi:8-oxo-dGTP pyrophosphatase MutT (NUDIX family)